MDLLSMLKLSNIFSPNGQMAQQNFPIGSIGGGTIDQQPDQAPQAPIIPGMDDNSNLMQMLSPKEDQYDRLSQLIQQIPQKSQYEPSLGRRISAFAANLGSGGPVGIAGGQPIGYKSNIPEGLKVQSAIEDDPYNKAIQNWLTQEQPTLEAAKLENARNINSRIAGSNIRTAQLREEGINRQRNWDYVRGQDLEEKQRNAAERTEISKQRAAANEYDKMHPNHVYKEDKDGNIFSLDPKTNAIEYLFDGEGNYIKSKNLSDEIKLKIRHADTMSEIGARGTEARKTELVRQTGRQDLEETKNTNKVNAGGTGGAAKPQSEAMKKVGNFNRATQYLNSHPEAKDFIHLSPGNNFTVTMPSNGDNKAYKDAYRFIYGTEPNSGAKIKMLHPDGTPGMVPIEQHEAALAQGYKDTK